MLTEYSTYDDIRKFRDKVLEKYEDMKRGWLGKKILRQVVLWKRDRKNYSMFQTFKLENQVVELEIYPAFYADGTYTSRWYNFRLCSAFETNKGRVWMMFSKTTDDIYFWTPHCMSRFKERFDSIAIPHVAAMEKVPYERDGKRFEFILHEDSVFIARRPEPDIVICITFLHRDMCTSRNYQELLERAGKDIDEHDIYVWK